MYSVDYLKSFTQEVFLKMGSSKEHAALASEVLLAADLRGSTLTGLPD